MNSWSSLRHTGRAVAFAFVLIVAAAGLRLWPLQALGPRLAWLTFYPAVMIIALLGGGIAGLVGTLLSCLAVVFLLPGAIGQPLLQDSADWLGLAVFALTCSGIAGVVDALHRKSEWEHKMEEQRDRFFDLATDPSCIAGFDGYFKRLNPAWEKTLGFSREELLARPYLDFVHPEDRDRTIAEATRLGDGQTAVLFENRYLRKDGSYCRLVWNAVSLTGEGLIFASARDVTAERAAVAALRASEARYHALFDSIDEGFCIIEVIFDDQQKPVDYRFLVINPAFERQTGLQDARGKRMRELAPEHEAHWFETYGRIALTGGAIRFQNRAAQLHRWYDVYAFRIGDPQQRQVAILFNDITQRREAETKIAQLNTELRQRTGQLEAANQELEAFCYSVSHDLRAPLRHIDGFVSLLHKHAAAGLDDKSRRYLDVIAGAARQMGRLIDDLLSFSRMSRVAMRPTLIDQQALVATVMREGRYEQNHPGIEWRIAPLPLAHADESMLRLVWANLIDNAVKYSGKTSQPRIEIGGGNGGAETTFFVRDNGAGFDPRYAAKLFSVFQRLHSDAEFEGTGIGLANVRRIINRHGGRTWAEGAVGRGATFYFSLPKASPAGATLDPSRS